MSARQEIDLTLPPGTGPVLVRVNGLVVAECFPGASQDRDALEAECAAAHASRAACRLLAKLGELLEKVAPDPVNKTIDKARGAFAAGLVDGWRGETSPHPYGDHIPPHPPEGSPAYRRGWGLGDGIRRALEVAA